MSALSGGGPVFSKGHGAQSEKGGLKSGKTEIRPSAAASVQSNWASRKPAGTVKFGGGNVDVSFVPRISNPLQFRPIGTKTGGGGANGPTSFPIDMNNANLASFNSILGSGESLTNEPNSPRTSSGSFMPPVK